MGEIERGSKKTFKSMVRLYNISVFIILFFSLSGIFWSSILLHELIHKNDLDKFVETSDICILEYPESIKEFFSFNYGGHYEYTYSSNMSSQVEKASKYTELRAYTIQGVILFLWMIIAFYFFIKSINREDIYIFRTQ